MALIQCPECGKEISDKVKACPFCGYPMDEDAGAPQPVAVTSISIQSDPAKRKKLITGIIAAVVVIIIAIAGFFAMQSSKAANERADYISNLNSVYLSMVSGGAQAEDVCNLTKSVWYNTIFEEYDLETNKYTRKNNGAGSFYDDFNDALTVLFTDKDMVSQISSIKENKTLVDSLMKDLQNPPEDLKNVYDLALEAYDSYTSLTDLAVSPSGSLQSYADEFSESDSALASAVKKLSSQIPEE